jgi:hypothetical protein
MDSKTFLPDGTWNPTGDAAIVANALLIAAATSYSEDFEGYNVNDIPPDFTPFTTTLYSVQIDGGQKVLQLSGATWCMVYLNNQTFVNGMIEAEFTQLANNRQITVAQRLDPAVKSGYLSQYINGNGFFQMGGGLSNGFAGDYPFFNNTQQISGIINPLPMIVKNQLADNGGGEVEIQMSVNGTYIGNYIDTAKKYAGTRIAVGSFIIGGIGYIKFWPTKTGGFSKTFTPFSLTSWGRVMIAMDVKASRNKGYSDIFEYQIDAGGFNPLPDDGDISGAAVGSTITIRSNSMLINDFDSSEDITVNSVAIQIDGEWDAPVSPPPAPTGLAVDAISRTAARVTWVDAVGVDYYRVYFNDVNNFSTASVGAFVAQGTQAATIPGLTPSTQYWFWVVSETAAGALSSEAGPVTVTMPAPASDTLEISEIQEALYDWAVAVIAAAGSSAPVIWEFEDGTRPTPPFVTLNLIGPRMTGGSDHISDNGVGDQTFIQQGMREITVSLSVYADNDSLSLATKLNSSLNNPQYIAQLSADKIGVGAVNDIQDLSEFLETEWERRSQFDFIIFAALNEEYTSPIIEQVDYDNNILP